MEYKINFPSNKIDLLKEFLKSNGGRITTDRSKDIILKENQIFTLKELKDIFGFSKNTTGYYNKVESYVLVKCLDGKTRRCKKESFEKHLCSFFRGWCPKQLMLTVSDGFLLVPYKN